MTKAVQFDSYGGVDVLEVRDVPRPVPGRAPSLLSSATAPRLREAATGITSFADRTKIAARILEPSAARYRCAFKSG